MSDDERLLTETFERVRRAYFPTWRPWSIRLNPDLPSWGNTRADRRLIGIRDVHGSDAPLEFLLVHEICHAVAGEGHGSGWQAEMLKAAGRARVLGDFGLAERLEEDAASYRHDLTRHRGDEADVKWKIREFVQNMPDADWRLALRWLLQEYAMEQDEFLRRFPDAEAWWREAIAERRSDRADADGRRPGRSRR